MDLNIAELLSKSGISLPDIMDKLPKILSFIPKAKSYIPMVKNLDVFFKIKENEKIIFSLMPVTPTYTGNETPEQKEKLDSLCEIKISVLVITKNAQGETVIDREVAIFKAFEEIEKISSLFPKMT